MNKEVYLWLILIVVVALAALYLRYFYQAQIGLELSLNTTGINLTMYPYQRLELPIIIYNSGASAIENLSVGLFTNGNFTVPYAITLPQGKQVVILYNYSPSKPGTYNIVVTADPGKLYNIPDRSKTTASISLVVKVPENASSYALLPNANRTSVQETNLDKGGYVVQAYLGNKYTTSDFALIKSTQINKILAPLLNDTFNDIYNMSVSTAEYANNDSEYSIWIRGYLNASVVLSLFSKASTSASQNVHTPFGNVTYITLPNSTTLCGWYSGGWLKLFGYVGSRTCYQVLSTGAKNGTSPSFVKMPDLTNVTSLANYTGSGINGKYAATLSLTPDSFIYAKISNGTSAVASDTCFGIVDSVNGISYCSTYISSISGQIGNLSLVRTSAYVGNYNLSVFSLSNTSELFYQVPININVVKGFGISGNYLRFTSALADTCAFNASFPCSNMTFANGVIRINVENDFGSAVKLNSLGCLTRGLFNSSNLGGLALAPGKSANLTASCFSNGAVLKGILLNLNLNLLLNYTIANRSQTLTGKAQVPFG